MEKVPLNVISMFLAGFSAIIFSVLQFVDQKMIKKQEIDVKSIIKSSVFTFVSVLAGSFLYEQFENINISSTLPESISSMTGGTNTAKVFTGVPDF